MRRDDPHPETYIPQTVSTASKATIDPRRHAPTFKHPHSFTTPGATPAPPLTPSDSVYHGNSMAWPPPKDPNVRDYKVIYDPFINGRRGESGKDFLYRYNGQVGPGEEPIRARDPRRDLSERNREGRGKAKLRTLLYVLEYEYDENSYGPPPPPPPRGICVSGLSPFTAAGFVKRHFSAYGTIEEFVSQVDKANGSSLGLFWIKYSDEDEDGHKSAQRALQNEDGRKIGSGNAAQPATVVLDADGQACRALYQQEMERRRKAWEENRRGNKPTAPVAVSNSPPHPTPSPLPPTPPTIPGLPSRPPPPTSGPVTGPDRTALATSMRPPNPPKPRSSASSTPTLRNTTLRPNHTPAIPSPLHSASSPVSSASPNVTEKPKAVVPAAATPAQPVDEEENHRDTLRLLALNGNDYIQIEKSSLPDESKAVEMEIRKFFGGYKVDRVMRDIHGWYISFDVSTDARRAIAALDDKTIAGRQVTFTVHPAPSIATLATTASRPRGDAKEWSETEFIQEARKIIMRDLLSVFAKDLRERVARPKTWKLVDEALEAHRTCEEKEVEDPLPPTESVAPGTTGGGIPAEVSVSTPKGLKGLSFKRQHQNVKVDINIFNRLTPQNRINLLNILNKKNATSESEIPISLPSPPPPVPEVLSSPPKPKSVPAAAIIDDESDANVARFERSLKRRKAGIERPEHKKKRPRRRVEFSDSDRSEAEDEPDSPPEPEPAPVPKPRPPTAKPLREKPRKPRSSKVDVVVTPPVDEPKTLELELELPKPKPAVSVSVSVSVPIPASPIPGDVKIPDPYAQQLVDDEEDLYYVRLALGLERGIPLPGRSIERPGEEDTTSHLPLGLRKHVTGSARTEGYYKIPEAAKSLYLPQRNRAIVDISAAAPLPVASSRSNRANSRRLAQGIEQHKGKAADAGDVLKFNQLRTRKKQLTFARSPIHDWGLYAAEFIPAGDMVIEYVGEVIRQQVADKREKYYEKTGIGSSYLFRVDDDSVVDATKKGNLGRLINHCCTPNCTAKIITINGEKKIVIYAKANIDIGDEITYDYHFPLEDQKIPCLCGSPKCRAYIPALSVHGSEKFSLKAVYSRSKSSSSTLAALAKERLGASADVYSEDGASEGGLDAILARPDIQAVIIVLPLTQQPEIVLKALAAGKNVLSEKPVAKDVKTGLDLIDNWEKNFKPKGLIWRVAENFEVEPGVLEAGKRIKAGAIGKVRFFNFSMIFPVNKDNKYYQTSWRTVPDYQGGFLLDAGVHTNAALRRVLGSSFPLDKAKVSAFASLTREHLAPHDTLQAVIQATLTSEEHPPQGIVEMSCAVQSGFSRHILTVTGTEGNLTLQSVTKPVKEADINLAKAFAFNRGTHENISASHWQTTIIGPDGSTTEEFDRISSGVYEEIGNFYNALSGKDDGNGEPRDALLDVALIQAFLTSQGNPVDMKKLLSTGSA